MHLQGHSSEVGAEAGISDPIFLKTVKRYVHTCFTCRLILTLG